ncbi:MAG: indole-3-glycerol phosphate synthase TrpC [Firmicutes bacterium HGW-Firmicutes-15]|nr:MAG: indole-3-glycerol phosphate synthase TrpC [Firmicutes bacterium HGW-Firmicutes-15]
MLSRIAAARQEDVNRYGEAIMEEFAHNDTLPAIREFIGMFSPNQKVSLIAEVKKASPSKGIFLVDFDPINLAVAYQQNGARAISVITEERFFQGSTHFIPQIKNQIELPILRKDFIIDERQLYETRLLGADAVLLIAGLLPDRLLPLVELAQKLGLEPLVEVHDGEELKQALDTPVRMIGINNRNLQDFSINLQVCLDLISQVPSGIYCIAESGISSPMDMLALEKHGFRGALVGEALVTASDIGAKVRELVGYQGVNHDQG